MYHCYAIAVTYGKNFVSKLIFTLFCLFPLLNVALHCSAYYDTYKCFGTLQGDCHIYTYMQEGGSNDPNYRWLTECQDQEALWGIFDSTDNFEGFAYMWCKNQFPLKPPTMGLYPYYPYCNFRDQTRNQYFCFDQRDPVKTYNTFVTGFWDAVDEELGYDPVGMKCCHTPPGYHIDYSTCYYKYTHDQHGEHYDGYWMVTCDNSFHLIVGVGQALNPWDREFHYTWIQCCPVVFVGDPIDPLTVQVALSIPMGTLDYVNPQYPLDAVLLAPAETLLPSLKPAKLSPVSGYVGVEHDEKTTKAYGYAEDPAHNIRYPNMSLPKNGKSSSNKKQATPHIRKPVLPPKAAAKAGGTSAGAAAYGDRHREERRKREARRVGTANLTHLATTNDHTKSDHFPNRAQSFDKRGVRTQYNKKKRRRGFAAVKFHRAAPTVVTSTVGPLEQQMRQSVVVLSEESATDDDSDTPLNSGIKMQVLQTAANGLAALKTVVVRRPPGYHEDDNDARDFVGF